MDGVPECQEGNSSDSSSRIDRLMFSKGLTLSLERATCATNRLVFWYAAPSRPKAALSHWQHPPRGSSPIGHVQQVGCPVWRYLLLPRRMASRLFPESA